MPARSVCLVALSLSEAGPGRFGRQVSVIDIYHTIHLPYRSLADLVLMKILVQYTHCTEVIRVHYKMLFVAQRRVVAT